MFLNIVLGTAEQKSITTVAGIENERSQYTFGMGGIHWRGLDEDISFESFEYDDAEPSALQRFFLTHKEINVAEFARLMGLNPTLLRNYNTCEGKSHLQ